MKILILGAGQVGRTAAQALSREEANEVTVVDLNEETLRDLQDRLDVRTVAGNAAHPTVLEAAGAAEAEIIVALTSSDEVNLVACEVAFTLFRTPTKIARIRAAEYASRPELFRTDGLSVFIVDMKAARGNGLSISPIRTMMNHSTTEVFFSDLRVPAENLIGEEGKGFRYILSGMNAERILIAAECIGDAKWFIAKATAYARERVVFGRPIGQNQGIQFPIAKAYAAMRAAELMVREATRRYEAGLDCGAEANMAKMLAADAAWEAANACVQTHGGFAFAEEYDVERKFRETRLYQVAPISTNLILSFLAEHVLGMPRSY